MLSQWLIARRAGQVRRAAIRELSGFTDAQLVDLGITRGEIPDYVAGRRQVASPRPSAEIIRFPRARVCCQKAVA